MFVHTEHTILRRDRKHSRRHATPHNTIRSTAAVLPIPFLYVSHSFCVSAQVPEFCTSTNYRDSWDEWLKGLVVAHSRLYFMLFRLHINHFTTPQHKYMFYMYICGCRMTGLPAYNFPILTMLFIFVLRIAFPTLYGTITATAHARTKY